MSGEFRQQVFRNVRILGTIFVCFVCGIFAAEAVGTWLEKKSRQEDAVEVQTTPPIAPPASNEQLP